MAAPTTKGRKSMITPTPQPPFIVEPTPASSEGEEDEEEEEIVTFRIGGHHVPAAASGCEYVWVWVCLCCGCYGLGWVWGGVRMH